MIALALAAAVSCGDVDASDYAVHDASAQGAEARFVLFGLVPFLQARHRPYKAGTLPALLSAQFLQGQSEHACHTPKGRFSPRSILRRTRAVHR